MSRQSRARRRAGRTHTPRAASSSGMIFRLSFPPGHDRTDQLDWRDLQARGIVTARIDHEDQVHLAFAAPFEHLTFKNGETLTVEKAANLKYALISLGAPIQERH